MRKKWICMLCIMLISALLFGCGTTEDARGNGQSFSTSSTLTCVIAHATGGNPNLELSKEQSDTIIAIWNSGAWEYDVTKTEYDYIFRIQGVEIRYCYAQGIFNDWTNKKHMVLSTEAKEKVNTIMDTFIIQPVVD